MMRLALVAVYLTCGEGLSMGADQTTPAAPETLMLADFEEPGVVERIIWNQSVSVALSEQDAVSGTHSLEVRVGPFSIHRDPWPYVFFTDRYFATPVDLSRYSRLVAVVRNVTEGLATVRITLSSKPYNDGGRNLEGESFVIPGGSTMECSLPTSLFRAAYNDPSAVQALMFVFPANETNAIYRIDAIRAVYDPAEGSPAEKLAAGADALQEQIRALEARVNWHAVPPERATTLRRRIPELAQTVKAVQLQAQEAQVHGWRGAFNQSREALDAIARSLGEFVLADKTGLYVWQRPRYSYVRRDALPDFSSPPLERIELQMAQNEFRDASWMVTACHKPLALRVAVEAEDETLADAIQFRWADFVQPADGEAYGDVLVPLDAPLVIPAGESRELWLTCDTRWHEVKPGRYELRLRLNDLATGASQIVPMSLTVWDFALPSYDILPNNAYVEYHNSEIGALVPEQGVRHMKMYGVNMVYVYPHELPWPVQVDEQLNITAFDPTTLVNRIVPIQKAWNAAPGNERLRWLFALTGAPERLLNNSAVVYPSEAWQRVFAQWLGRFRDLMSSLGIGDGEWIFVLGDEASESALVTYEIPLAEIIKRIDNRIILSCNASQVINDPRMAERFFRAFDILQPNLDALKQSPALREWIGVNRRPLWTYRCQSMAGLDRNLYAYYRVYAWENLRYGITGTGIWTYCAQGESPWGQSQRGIAYNLVFKHRDRPQVVHSRRYEFYREGLDDYRYVQALLMASRQRGDEAQRQAQELLSQAIADITADVGDVTRCERWRLRIADTILNLAVRRLPPTG